jgi:hypothetical protein
MARRGPNGWVRIGIVLSVLWAVGFPLWWVAEQADTLDRLRDFSLSLCDSKPATERSACRDEAIQSRIALGTGLDWGVVLAVDAAWLAFGWAVCASMYFVTRWVVRGFRREGVSET